MPQSELDKIQEAPRHCDQRNSAFPPGAGGELRKQPEVCLSPPLLPWPEFYLCPPLPAGTGEPGYTQPGTPLQDSHPQRLSGILTNCSYPQSQTAVRVAVRRRWSSAAQYSWGQAVPPYTGPLPIGHPMRGRDQWAGTLPLAAASDSYPREPGATQFGLGKPSGASVIILSIPGLGPYFCLPLEQQKMGQG